MGIKKYSPTTPGRRWGAVLDYSEITKSKPEKSLLEPIRQRGGRNNLGRVTSRHRGGGNKRMYRVIDFKRRKDGVAGKVAAIEYDPNRSCFIALVEYPDAEKRYILAPLGLNVGAKVESGDSVEPAVGNTMPMRSIPVGLEVHNIEMNPGQGGRLVRAAGGTARLMAREGDWAVIQLPSGEMRRVRAECRATIGQLGNLDHSNIALGKAGRNRHRGKRPHVRAMVMNPVDHPMGGGEGRSKSNKHPQSPTGVLAKGGKTRKPRKPSNKWIIRRRRSVRYGQLVL